MSINFIYISNNKLFQSFNNIIYSYSYDMTNVIDIIKFKTDLWIILYNDGQIWKIDSLNNFNNISPIKNPFPSNNVKIISLTQLTDSNLTILGLGNDYKLYQKNTLDSNWILLTTYPLGQNNSNKFMYITCSYNGLLFGVTLNGLLKVMTTNISDGISNMLNYKNFNTSGLDLSMYWNNISVNSTIIRVNKIQFDNYTNNYYVTDIDKNLFKIYIPTTLNKLGISIYIDNIYTCIPINTNITNIVSFCILEKSDILINNGLFFCKPDINTNILTCTDIFGDSIFQLIDIGNGYLLTRNNFICENNGINIILTQITILTLISSIIGTNITNFLTIIKPTYIFRFKQIGRNDFGFCTYTISQNNNIFYTQSNYCIITFNTNNPNYIYNSSDISSLSNINSTFYLIVNSFASSSCIKNSTLIKNVNYINKQCIDNFNTYKDNVLADLKKATLNYQNFYNNIYPSGWYLDINDINNQYSIVNNGEKIDCNSITYNANVCSTDFISKNTQECCKCSKYANGEESIRPKINSSLQPFKNYQDKCFIGISGCGSGITDPSIPTNFSCYFNQNSSTKLKQNRFQSQLDNLQTQITNTQGLVDIINKGVSPQPISINLPSFCCQNISIVVKSEGGNINISEINNNCSLSSSDSSSANYNDSINVLTSTTSNSLNIESFTNQPFILNSLHQKSIDNTGIISIIIVIIIIIIIIIICLKICQSKYDSQ